MPELPEDFKSLLAPKEAKDKRPFQYLFVFDPETNHVHLQPEHDGTKDAPMHHEMAEDIHHPEKVQGYAVAIKDGWRIMTDELGEVDPYVREQVRRALRGQHQSVPLPQIRYHGSPVQAHTPELAQQIAEIDDTHDYWPEHELDEPAEGDN